MRAFFSEYILMDRKSLIAIVLMAVIFFIWSSYLNSSKEKEAALQKKYDDSVALVEKKRKRSTDSIAKLKTDSVQKAIVLDSAGKAKLDSMKLVEEKGRYGFFSAAAKGDNTPVVIENEKLKISIFPRGGRIGQVELKGVKTYSGKPLILFTGDSTHFGLQFFDAKRRLMNTDSLYFKAEGKAFAVTGNDSNAIRMRLYADDATDKYIEYVYSLRGGSYMSGCTINFVGLTGVVDRDLHSFDLQWSMNTPVQEKSLKNERMVATVHYRFDDETVEALSKTEAENKQLTGSVKWVSFSQQYFTSTLIPKTAFTNGSIVDVRTPSDPFSVKHFGALLPVPYTHGASESFATQFYFGPSDYHQLKSYNLDLEKQLDLGWGPFAWINKYAIFPIFDFLSSFIGNYGIVILLITIIVKIVLFPIAYKSFLSSAKMRVLKPEIDEINEKFKDGDPLEKNKATMGLYRKAGVNPMAGCIPLLLQIPILFALIRFFPSAYDLRQASFLWAEDLSTYDSIWTFGHVPVIDSIYGDHVSLFALLMTISTLLYTWMNQQMLSPGSTQLPGMKYLIYIMPIFFLGFLNSYSSALSYYYFLSNMITFGQMFIMRRFVDEGAIRAKIEENKKKPAKTSSFMQRLEQAQRERMKQVQDQKNGGKKKK